MVCLKSPALAGLFFVSIQVFTGGLTAGPAKLSPSAQQYFRAFIETFTPLVLKRERKAGNARWGEKNRDCAGLIRYLFWEAFQPHSENFLDSYPQLRGIVLRPDSNQFSAIQRDWSEKNFTAQQLVRRSRFIGRNFDLARLKSGDLLYFESAELKIRHVMLAIRSGREIFLVYHTGDERDELRIRRRADIAGLAESEWHPDAANPVFRGIFRPAFLD